jgi:hypothetical protein
MTRQAEIVLKRVASGGDYGGILDEQGEVLLVSDFVEGVNTVRIQSLRVDLDIELIPCLPRPL